MMRIDRLGNTFVLTVLLAGAPAAVAADLGGAPPQQFADPMQAPRWSGFYVGANAGYASGFTSTRENTADPFAYGSDFERFRFSSTGFTGGGQFGYNWQFGSLVAGIEADLNYVDLSRSATSPSGAINSSVTGNYIGTVRPKLGVALGPVLLYGTAGLAYGNTTGTITGNTANAITATESGIKTGIAAGLGLEYALNSHWSLRTEYLHTSLGHGNEISAVGLDGNTYSWRDRTTENSIRLGINYRF